MNTEITSKENSIKELQYEIKEIENIKAQVDADEDLTEVFPKEITTVIYV